MAKPRNYIAYRNPFQMAQPPGWWLDGIYHFDPEIVIMPSQERIGVYWVTRRRQHSIGSIGLTHKAISNEVQASLTDTAMFLTHHVEPSVDIVTPAGVWALDKVLGWLREHDTWAIEGGPLTAAGLAKAMSEGGSKFTKQFEANEAEADRLKKVEQRERIHMATGDGWQSLQRRKGRRINNAGLPPDARPSLIHTGA